MSDPKLLTEEDYQRAAAALGCEVAAIKAVTEVEAAGAGFLPDGRVKILFERHKFYKFTGGRYASTHPDICNPSAGGYGAGGAHQYARFSRAFALDPKAAMKSASWGKFQIMGFNFASAGFDSVDSMIDAMKQSEGAQLLAFVNFVKSCQLSDELRRHDWAGFARQYNGANYRINRYDAKLAAAYKKHAQAHPAHVAVMPAIHEEAIGHSIIEDVQTPPDIMPQNGNGAGDFASPPSAFDGGGFVSGFTVPDAPAAPLETEEAQKVKQSLESKLTAWWPMVTGPVAAAWLGFKSTILDNPFVLGAIVLLLVVGFAIGAWLWNESKKRQAAQQHKLIDVAASPDRHTVLIEPAPPKAG
jgi:hypothetical protein